MKDADDPEMFRIIADQIKSYFKTFGVDDELQAGVMAANVTQLIMPPLLRYLADKEPSPPGPLA